MNLPLIWQIPVLLLLGLLLSAYATAGISVQYSEMSFPALLNGRQPSIIHVDTQGHVTAEPIDFLRGQTVQSWDVATLDNVVTCNKDLLHADDYDLKYYRHHVLAQTFHLQNAIPEIWMHLQPEKHCLLVQISKNGHPVIVKFELDTGIKTEVTIDSKKSAMGYPILHGRPIWDSVQGNYIVHVEDKFSTDTSSHEYLARLNPDNFTLKDEVPLEVHAADPLIGGLLAYDKVNNSVICSGVIPEPPLYTYHGRSALFSVSLDTGKAKVMMEDTTPNFSGKASGPSAVINKQYMILTRVEGPGIEGEGPRTFLLDLKNQTWADLYPIVPHADIPYVTWPISQEGLHVETTPTTPSNH